MQRTASLCRQVVERFKILYLDCSLEMTACTNNLAIKYMGQKGIKIMTNPLIKRIKDNKLTNQKTFEVTFSLTSNNHNDALDFKTVNNHLPSFEQRF